MIYNKKLTSVDWKRGVAIGQGSASVVVEVEQAVNKFDFNEIWK